jgi:hypothetical protein
MSTAVAPRIFQPPISVSRYSGYPSCKMKVVSDSIFSS